MRGSLWPDGPRLPPAPDSASLAAAWRAGNAGTTVIATGPVILNQATDGAVINAAPVAAPAQGFPVAAAQEVQMKPMV